MRGLVNFKNGVASFGIPLVGSGQIPVTTGTYFFVHSGMGNSGYSGLKPSRPLATIDQAINKCTADKNDVIIVMPGHAESVSSSGAMSIDIAGITIIGLGEGLNRPVVTLDTADTARIAVAGANCTVRNIVFRANYADIATVFLLAAAKDFCVRDCDFIDAATNMNFLSIIVTGATANAADGLSFINNRRYDMDAAGLATISILGNLDRLTVADNYAETLSAANVGHFIIMSSKVCKGAIIVRNTLAINGDNNAQTVGLFMTGSSETSTGVVAYNLVGSLDATTELFDTATLDFWHFENYVTGALAKQGYLVPGADS